MHGGSLLTEPQSALVRSLGRFGLTLCDVETLTFSEVPPAPGRSPFPGAGIGWKSPQFNIEACADDGWSSRSPGHTGLHYLFGRLSAALLHPSAEWKMAIGVSAPRASGMVDFEAAKKVGALCP